VWWGLYTVTTNPRYLLSTTQQSALCLGPYNGRNMRHCWLENAHVTHTVCKASCLQRGLPSRMIRFCDATQCSLDVAAFVLGWQTVEAHNTIATSQYFNRYGAPNCSRVTSMVYCTRPRKRSKKKYSHRKESRVRCTNEFFRSSKWGDFEHNLRDLTTWKFKVADGRSREMRYTTVAQHKWSRWWYFILAWWKRSGFGTTTVTI